MIKKYVLLLLTIFLCVASFAQTIQGHVYDKNTKQPLESVSIYFDNTTIGAVTNNKGYFKIDYSSNTTSPLVISYLGYKKIINQEYKPKEDYVFYLEEDLNSLDEVVLEVKDEWSRTKKMKEFKEQFLGSTKNAKSCKILNEADITLYYNSPKKQLVAYASKPIIVLNKSLNYKIKYDLQEFSIDYTLREVLVGNNLKTKKKVYQVETVFYAGTTLFSDIEEETNPKILEKRNKAFDGSILHFMRALVNDQLEEEEFVILQEGSKVAPEHYISIRKTEREGLVKVRISKEMEVVYKNRRRSSILPIAEEFTVDALGVYSPIKSLNFSGDMSVNRMSDALPLDFRLETNLF
ncbi:carboxypeptidase-like regulatory domain-containing protein [Lacinutrix sp. MEBiC02404]